MRVIKWLDERFEEFIMVLLLTLISCVMMLQVIMRYCFNSSLSWAEELCRYAFIWSAFLSIGFSIKNKSILRVDTVMELMPGFIKTILKLFTQCIVVVFFIYLFYHSIAVIRAIRLSGQISPAMGIPMYLIYASAMVGFFLTIIRSIQSTIGIIKESRKQ